MNEFDLDKILRPRLTVMRIILFALVIGSLAFMGIVLAMRLSPNPPNAANTAPLMTYMGMGFGLLMFLLHLIIPRLVVANARNGIARGTWNPSDPRHPLSPEQIRSMGDIGLLLALYQSQVIIGLAMLEGATFFNLIAYLLEGDAASLVVAGLLVVVMLSHFPTQPRLEAFLEQQGELVRQQRQAV
jgi:hypothetical protein